MTGFRACCFFLLLLFVTTSAESQSATVTNATPKIANSDCLACHSDFPTSQFDHSTHSVLDCVDCHTGIKEIPHADHLPPPDCNSCHPDETKAYNSSIHGVSRQLGSSAAAECWDCHGSHGILPVNDPASPVYKMNLPFTCGKCHNNPGLTKEYRILYPDAAKQFVDSIHGQALLKMGLIVAPSCDDCHGVHDIKRAWIPRFARSTTPTSPRPAANATSASRKPTTRAFTASCSRPAIQRGPVCTDCHTRARNRQIRRRQQFQRGHQRPTLRQMPSRPPRSITEDTYHGKAMALGKPNRRPGRRRVLRLPRLSRRAAAVRSRARLCPRTNILATCQQCHPSATDRLHRIPAARQSARQGRTIRCCTSCFWP